MIDDPQAVRFCNDVIRPLADRYAQLYYASKTGTDVWAAQDIGTLIPSTSEIIDDGSASDGRAQITGAKVNGFVNALNALIADLEASSLAKLNVLLQIAVQPTKV